MQLPSVTGQDHTRTQIIKHCKYNDEATSDKTVVKNHERDENAVEDREDDEEPVERVQHVFSRENIAGKEVAK